MKKSLTAVKLKTCAENARINDTKLEQTEAHISIKKLNSKSTNKQQQKCVLS